MTRTTSDTAPTWAKSHPHLPSELARFVLNAVIDTLPHNANLHLLTKDTSSCSLCGERQTLIHMLLPPVRCEADTDSHAPAPCVV